MPIDKSKLLNKMRGGPAPKKPEQPKPPTEKPKPEVVATEKVTALCGHTLDFAHFSEKQDKFREARRKKLTDKPCPDCRAKANAERVAVEKVAIAERKKNRPPKQQYSSIKIERLPHGSTFAFEPFDLPNLLWKGTLTIVCPPPGVAIDLSLFPVTFSSQNTAFFRLATILDRQWRRWFEDHLPAEKVEDSEKIPLDTETGTN